MRWFVTWVRSFKWHCFVLIICSWFCLYSLRWNFGLGNIRAEIFSNFSTGRQIFSHKICVLRLIYWFSCMTSSLLIKVKGNVFLYSTKIFFENYLYCERGSISLKGCVEHFLEFFIHKTWTLKLNFTKSP